MPHIVKNNRHLCLIDPVTGVEFKCFDLCCFSYGSNRNGDLSLKDCTGTRQKYSVDVWLNDYGIDATVLDAIIAAAECGGGTPPTPTPPIDKELACASTDGRLIIVDLSTNPVSITELDGIPIGDGATPVSCNTDYEEIQKCYQDITDNSIQYTRITWFEAPDFLTVVATTWVDNLGTVVPAPVNIEPCLALDQEYENETVELCAINDSPVDYPNPGDPPGTAYQSGDRIFFKAISEVNDLFNPVVRYAKNLSNQTFPNVFWIESATLNIGTEPPSTDFGDCCISTPEGVKINWG